ncbi:MAG: M14 family zinc carboxypeptidase [Anaerolineae bacterium]
MKHRLIWIVSIPIFTLAFASVLAKTIEPTQSAQSDLAIIKVEWDSREELNWLKAAYDVWEVVPEDQVVFIAADPKTATSLRDDGWQATVDVAQTNFHLNQPSDQRAVDTYFGGYKTNSEILADMQSLNAAYPDLTEIFDYGDSLCKIESGCTTPDGDSLPGHDLLALRISNEAISGTSHISGTEVISGSKPIFMLHAGIHSREIATPETALRFARWLLENHTQDAQVRAIVDWQESWIIPLANPDGYDVVLLGTESKYGGVPLLHRKNGRGADANNCAWPSNSGNHFGVDLNRNHSFGWGPIGTSLSPCSQTYRGTGGASEPETAAFETLVSSLISDQRGPNRTDAAPNDAAGLMITMHSYGEDVIWPWGDGIFPDNFAPNHADLKAIGDRLAQTAGYESWQGNDYGGVSGATEDHVYGELGIPSFNFEIGTKFLQSYEETTTTIWSSNRPALLYAAGIAQAPYQMVHGPEISNLTYTVSNETIIITGTVSDAKSGDNSILTVFAAATLPVSATTTMTATAIDGMFDTSSEQFVLGPIPFTHPTGIPKSCSLALFFRGSDQQGFLGPVNGIIATPSNCRPELYLPLTLNH